MTVFVPSDILSQLRSVGEADCPYCLAFPSIPCVVHAGAGDRYDHPEQLAEQVRDRA